MIFYVTFQSVNKATDDFLCEHPCGPPYAPCPCGPVGTTRHHPNGSPGTHRTHNRSKHTFPRLGRTYGWSQRWVKSEPKVSQRATKMHKKNDVPKSMHFGGFRNTLGSFSEPNMNRHMFQKKKKAWGKGCEILGLRITQEIREILEGGGGARDDFWILTCEIQGRLRVIERFTGLE